MAPVAPGPVAFTVAVWRPDPVDHPCQYALYAEIPLSNVTVPAGLPALPDGPARLVTPWAFTGSTSTLLYSPNFLVAPDAEVPKGPGAEPFVTVRVPAGSGTGRVDDGSRMAVSVAADLAGATWTPAVPSPGRAGMAFVVSASALFVPGGGIATRFVFSNEPPFSPPVVPDPCEGVVPPDPLLFEA